MQSIKLPTLHCQNTYSYTSRCLHNARTFFNAIRVVFKLYIATQCLRRECNWKDCLKVKPIFEAIRVYHHIAYPKKLHEESTLVNVMLSLSTSRRHEISALDIVKWSTSRPGCFTPGKEPLYPLKTRLRGRKGRSRSFGEQINILSLTRFEPRNFDLIT
jgi:hypothetical protein